MGWKRSSWLLLFIAIVVLIMVVMQEDTGAWVGGVNSLIRRSMHDCSTLEKAKPNSKYYVEGVVYGQNLRLDHVRGWCLEKPNRRNCQCLDPFEPVDREYSEAWRESLQANKRLVSEALERTFEIERWRNPFVDDYSIRHRRFTLDIAFVGDSWIEAWNGRCFGMTERNDQIDAMTVFRDHFQQALPKEEERNDMSAQEFDDDARQPRNAVALGIGGDMISNLLWRLQKGEEIPYDKLRPRVWWILIGMHDLAPPYACSEDVVLIGILRIVEEMQRAQPEALVVVNSLPAAANSWEGGSASGLEINKDEWRASVTRTNERLKGILQRVENATFFDASDVFSDIQSLTPPSLEIYENWARSISSFFSESIGLGGMRRTTVDVPKQT